MPENKLAEVRRERGLTQADLAYRSGLSPGTIGKIEQGTHSARPNTRRLLCRALRWPYSKHAELFGPLAKPGKESQ
jgi:DNA-binding XRE family transcriptional regulator